MAPLARKSRQSRASRSYSRKSRVVRSTYSPSPLPVREGMEADESVRECLMLTVEESDYKVIQDPPVDSNREAKEEFKFISDQAPDIEATVNYHNTVPDLGESLGVGNLPQGEDNQRVNQQLSTVASRSMSVTAKAYMDFMVAFPHILPILLDLERSYLIRYRLISVANWIEKNQGVLSCRNVAKARLSAIQNDCNRYESFYGQLPHGLSRVLADFLAVVTQWALVVLDRPLPRSDKLAMATLEDWLNLFRTLGNVANRILTISAYDFSSTTNLLNKETYAIQVPVWLHEPFPPALCLPHEAPNEKL